MVYPYPKNDIQIVKINTLTLFNTFLFLIFNFWQISMVSKYVLGKALYVHPWNHIQYNSKYREKDKQKIN